MAWIGDCLVLPGPGQKEDLLGKFKALAVLLLAFVAQVAWAHPHIWISSKAEVVVKHGTVEGFWATWTFDEMFSTVVTAFPHGADGRFSPDTIRAIQTHDFDNLSNFHYFCWVYWNGSRLFPTSVSHFQTWLVAGGTKAVYRFFVPIHRRIHPGDELTLAMYDDSYYTQILWAKHQPLTGADGAVVRFRPNPGRAYYGGFVIPVEAHLIWEKAP